MTECQHAACTDPAEMEIEMEEGGQYDLCEDHAHMNIDGSPVDGYDPNDADKFSYE